MKSPSFCMKTFKRESHKTYGPPASVTLLQLLCKHTNTGISTVLIANTMIYAHTTSFTFRLGSPTLPASEAGDFLELLLLYRTENAHKWDIIRVAEGEKRGEVVPRYVDKKECVLFLIQL